MATELTKGQNTALTAGRIRVSAEVALSTDISALLVNASGKVRSDADFIFYNQPHGPGVTLLPGNNGPALIDIDLAALPPEIAKVRIVASLDGSGRQFGQVPPLTAWVHDNSGTPLIKYVVSGLTVETIMIALEVYRRGTDWKVRAVGQGYAGGLSELVTDHGVVVDGPPSPTPTRAQPAPMSTPPPMSPPPPMAAPPPMSAPGPMAMPPQPFAPPTGGYQQPPMQHPPIQNQQPAPGYQPPTAPQPMGPPPGAPSAPGVTGASNAVGGPGGRVNLVKGQRVSLSKPDGSGLTLVRMGLGWDPLKRRSMFGRREAEIDLDASAIMFADRQPVDVVFYNHPQSKDGSIQHTGDNRTGHGDGDDESIIVDLTRVSAHVTTIVFVVTSYTGSTFAQIENAFCRLVDERTNAELVRYTLSGGTPCTATVMTKVYRDGTAWKMAAIGEGAQGRTPLDLVPMLGSYL